MSVGRGVREGAPPFCFSGGFMVSVWYFGFFVIGCLVAHMFVRDL